MSKTERPQVLIGERVLWLGSGSGLPKSGRVKWIGRLPEMGPDWNVGLELDTPLPYGGIDGAWGNRTLFQCRAKHGLIVPLSSVIQPPNHAKASEDQNTSKGRAHQSLVLQEQREFQRQISSESIQEDDDVFLSAPEDYDTANREGSINDSPPNVFSRNLSLLGTLRPHPARHPLQAYIDEILVDENQNARRRERRATMIHGKSSFRRGNDHLEKQSSVSSSKSSNSRRERPSLFSIFRWFKKERKSESDSDSPPFPSSPVLRRVGRSVSGSVDTLFSTATANSFSFVSPSYYRPYGGAQPPDIRISSNEPDTTSYRRRIKQRDIRRLTERNISLKEKYRLYASGTLPGSADRINELSRAYDEIAASCSGASSSLGRKKRKAPPPPHTRASTSDDNRPPADDSQVKHHRRANSEPVKYAKGSCHVKGKRKAPPPPLKLNLNTSTLSLRRRKRNAPLPPEGPVNFDSEESASTASTIDVSQVDVVSTDTLKLERGILKPNKMERPLSAEPKFTPSSPVSPRPWYKRNTRADQFGKSSERRKDRERTRVEDWMLESGFPRFPVNGPTEKLNIFSKIERIDDKRKSAISILTNISELDREAAAIVQKGRAMKEAMTANQDAMFYSKNVASPVSNSQEGERENSTKELISLFNAITNTKEAVNRDFAGEEGIFDGKEAGKSKSDGLHQVIIDEQEIRIKNSAEPGPSSDTSGPSRIAKVTIEELDAFDAERHSKARALFEANRCARPRSPPIPTIAEVAEGSHAAPPMSPSPPKPPGELVWICPRCTLENSRWKLICEACDKWRPIPCEFAEQRQKLNIAKEPLPVLRIVEPKDKNPTEKDNSGKSLTITDLLFKTNSEDVTVTVPVQPTSPDAPTGEKDSIGAVALETNENVSLRKDCTLKDKDGTNLETADEHTQKATEHDEKLIDTEEVRKARMAFFNKILESWNKENDLGTVHEEKENNLQMDDNTINNLDKRETYKNIETITEFPYEPKLTNSNIEDKQKLKEMLKEMKHSLPKRSKELKVNDSDESKDNSAEKPSGGARPKVFPEENYKHDVEKAEAYLVESKTIVEEIQVRKPTEKVSSSAQTSALVRQIAPRVKPPSGREYIVPMTVTETSIKDGVLYTSVSNQVKKIGSGTFELLPQRDFAHIKAVKSNDAVPDHLYANTPAGHETVGMSKATELEHLSHQLSGAEGIANFKAGLSTGQDKNMNTMSLNRLLRKLESAIANGQHDMAASLAKDLAHMKVNCCVTRQKSEASSSQIQVDMYVEDKINHQGPIPIKVQPLMTVKQLKFKIEAEYEIPVGVQRWILGRVLATDDSATLESMGVTANGSPIFLYLVAPEITTKREPEGAQALDPRELTKDAEEKTEENKIERENKQFQFGTLALGWKCSRCTLVNSPTRPGCAACGTDRPKNYEIPDEYEINQAEIERIQREKEQEEEAARVAESEKKKHYQKLMDLEKDDIILSTEPSECPVCLSEYGPLEGVVLRECLHIFCKPCLENTIKYSDEAEVKCPFRDENYICDSTLLEREIKALVKPEVYEEHLAKSIALAETKIGNAFHCKTPDCRGWCIYEDNVNTFKCPVCTHTNCLTCQAIHEGLNCKQFQERIHQDSDTNAESKRTKEMLQEMVERGEAMNCPTCQVILMKKWGCDWLRCSMCKTEICWITRGPRWGPNGKGDTSAGCQCGLNGVKCHPKCTYCH